MTEHEIVAVKHDERRNGTRCARYWAIEENPKNINDLHIYDHWFCRKLPKRILNILETSPEDPEGYGEKRGNFILTLSEPLVFGDFGHVKLKNIVSIKAKDAPTDNKEVA